MADLRRWIAFKFESFGHWVYKHPLLVLLVTLVPVVALISQVPKTTIDTSTEGFLHENDPILKQYNAFREQFGRDELILIALNPPEVFDFGFLEKLKALHEDLENEVPYIDDITSLINARMTRGTAGELIVEDLLEEWPKDAAALAEVKAWVLSNPIYRNLLISEDGRFTTVVIKTHSHSGVETDLTDILEGFDGFDDSGETAQETSPETERQFLTDAENSEIVTAVQSVVERYRADDLPIYLAGSPVVTDVLKKSMQSDMLRFIRLAILAIGLLLLILFRRISGVVLPLLIVGLSLLATLGLMAWLGAPVKLPTMILPSFLLAVGVGDSVHVLAIFFYRLRHGDSKEDAIAYALGHSGLAIVMTSLTTAGGLLSFAPAELAPISDLGLFAPFGVMLALILTIVLLPALLALIPIRAKSPSQTSPQVAFLDDLLARIGDFATSHPWGVIAGTVAVLAIAVWGGLQVRFSHHPLQWFPNDSTVRRATEKIDHELRGSISVEVLADAGAENGWYDPERLRRLDEVSRYIESLHNGDVFVGKTMSVAEMLKEINKALNENRPEFYTIPEDRELIAQEFLLFENSGSDDLEDVVDSQFSLARLTIKAPWVDATQYRPVLAQIEARLHEAFGDDVQITITGLMALLSRTIRAVMASMVKSYLIAFVVIAGLMVLMIGSVKIGLISMIPNLTPIVITLGVMGWFGLPLDAFTLLIGSIAIGLAVDDTIHFMHNFRRYYGESRDAKLAVHNTLQTSGRAMLFTSLVLSAGFFIFTLASMHNLFNFGLLTGLTILTALLADFLLAPALMTIVTSHTKTN